MRQLFRLEQLALNDARDERGCAVLILRGVLYDRFDRGLVATTRVAA